MTNQKIDEFFLAKLESLYDSAMRDGYEKHTAFLDGHQYTLASNLLKHRIGVAFYGGFSDAERKVMMAFPDYLTEDQLDYPFAFIQMTFPKNHTISHRDVLGSLMALQIKRETVGDILFGEGVAQLVVLDHLKELILPIDKVGRVGVQTIEIPAITLDQHRNYREISGTVSSMRLDSVLAVALKLSRSKVVPLLQSGKVFVNDLEVLKSDKLLVEGDILKVRGHGKFLLAQPGRMTKKGRYHITINQYI